MEYLFSLLISLLLSLFGAESIHQNSESVISTSTVEVVEVVDGDTIRVLIDNQVESVRYIGIDTPEPYREGEPECFSAEASARNRELVMGKEVVLVADVEERDKYERLLRYVYVDGVFVNGVLVQEGYATTLNIPPNSKHATSFKRAKESAKSNRLGLWSVCK